MFSSSVINLWISTLLILLIPGPAMLYVAGQTLANGRMAGWQAVLGLHLGRYFHVLWAAVSISLVIVVFPGVYAAMRAIGAVYLLWLGFSVVMSVANSNLEETKGSHEPERRSFLQSVAFEVLNPQTLILFISLLPRFVDVNASNPALKLVLLGALMNLAASLGDLGAMACARLVRSGLGEKMGMIRKMQLGGGTLIVGLGMHILLPTS